MTERFYHVDEAVHPDITRYDGVPTPLCPCIWLGAGPVAPNWADGAELIGREELEIEFLAESENWLVVDHWVKGPHHVWVSVETGRVVRMWQPFNGLEVFDPIGWEIPFDDESIFDLPL